MSGTLAEHVAEALETVIDPELGYNIIDIGLVYDLEVEGGRVRILLTTTTPGCPATAFIREAVESCVAAVPGVGAVEVQMTWQPRWSPERMSEKAKAYLGFTGR
jgi:metal-sulfur cluster biosynthetic enzyme